jgi:hypothetical protein
VQAGCASLARVVGWATAGVDPKVLDKLNSVGLHCAGAPAGRILGLLVHALASGKGKYALGTACIGGGQGMVVILQACSVEALKKNCNFIRLPATLSRSCPLAQRPAPDRPWLQPLPLPLPLLAPPP